MNVDELRKWAKDRKVRTWKRLLLMLYEIGDDPWGITDISNFLNQHRQQTQKVLKKLEIDGLVKNVNKKWTVTDRGVKRLKYYQKKGQIPKRD